jgi:hypothetical protein
MKSTTIPSPLPTQSRGVSLVKECFASSGEDVLPTVVGFRHVGLATCENIMIPLFVHSIQSFRKSILPDIVPSLAQTPCPQIRWLIVQTSWWRPCPSWPVYHACCPVKILALTNDPQPAVGHVTYTSFIGFIGAAK